VGCFVKVLAGWVDRTGLGDTVLVAGSYEVTPPWRTVGGVDRSLRGQHRSVRQPVTGSDPTHVLVLLEGGAWTFGGRHLGSDGDEPSAGVDAGSNEPTRC